MPSCTCDLQPKLNARVGCQWLQDVKHSQTQSSLSTTETNVKNLGSQGEHLSMWKDYKKGDKNQQKIWYWSTATGRILSPRLALAFRVVAWNSPTGKPGGTLPGAVLGTKAAGEQVPVITGGGELACPGIPWGAYGWRVALACAGAHGCRSYRLEEMETSTPLGHWELWWSKL